METTPKLKRVLIAEDNRVAADVLKFNFQRHGFDATIAKHGGQAIQFLDEQQFDLIITDYNMPVASGEEVCRHARKSVAHQETPIIMLSAKAFELDVPLLTKQYSLTEVIFKPYSPRELERLIQSIFAPTTV